MKARKAMWTGAANLNRNGRGPDSEIRRKYIGKDGQFKKPNTFSMQVSCDSDEEVTEIENGVKVGKSGTKKKSKHNKKPQEPPVPRKRNWGNTKVEKVDFEESPSESDPDGAKKYAKYME